MTPASIMDLFYRTRVFQTPNGAWRVDYVLPYSGRLYVDFNTWDEAWEEACGIEMYRAYV